MRNPLEHIDDQHERAPNSPDLVPIDKLGIPTSFDQPVFPGISMNPHAQEVQLGSDNLAFVGINSAAYTYIPSEQ